MSNKKRQPPKGNFSRKNEDGFTMIEAIVAIFVLTIGLIGTAAAITYALQFGSISRNVGSAKSVIVAAIEEIETLRNAQRLNFRQIANVGKVNNADASNQFNGFSVVELNMKNLARWLDGVYDTNLLAGTNAVSANIKGTEGYIVYVSDRRGDRVNAEYLSDGASYASSNGTVDNEDIYGPNGTLDGGEDVIDFGWDASKGAASKKGTMQKDILELPDTGSCWSVNPQSFGCGIYPDRRSLGIKAMSYPVTHFRRAVRLFNGEKLSTSAANGKLSPTKGISVSSENMVYIWGNYNTTGITTLPANGSNLNNGDYTGAQVPASIVCDAFFPLSKTWFDGLSAMYPEGSAAPRMLGGTAYRMADDNLPNNSEGTSMRAGIIAGTTISGLTATPGRDSVGLRRNGGIINYPRFLELWNLNGTTRSWNYSGSFVPLFRSTQALSQWENDTAVIYMPPRRNWSFDSTFLSPDKLPPGTPFFQYVQATGFRQDLR